MRMRSIVCGLLLTTALLWSRPADAGLITIEPDNFVPGTNITAATPGVLLWSALTTGMPGDPLLLSAVYAQHSSACDDGDIFTQCFAATGSMGFSPSSSPEGSLISWSSDRNPANCFAVLNGSGGPSSACESAFAGFRALLIELTEPTSFVEVAGGWNADYLELRAFDEDFNRLGLDQTLTTNSRLPGFGNTGSVAMTAPTAMMKYVFAGSTEGGIALDRVSVDSVAVPEPSTLLIAMAGCVGLCAHRRRTRLKKSS